MTADPVHALASSPLKDDSRINELSTNVTLKWRNGQGVIVINEPARPPPVRITYLTSGRRSLKHH